MLQSVMCFSAWLKDTVDPMLVTLNHRIAALTGLDVRPPYAEYLQVVNYGIGGHYEPHFDHATVMGQGQLPAVGAGTLVSSLMRSSPRAQCTLSEVSGQQVLFQE